MKDNARNNHKTLIKETEDDSKKWKEFQALGLEELMLLKGHTTQSHIQI